MCFCLWKWAIDWGFCKDSTRQDQSGNCKVYCATATARKVVKKGPQWVFLWWAQMGGDVMGHAMEAWPAWSTAAQCLKANVNWTAHLPHVRIINTFAGCFKLLYSGKRRGLWRVHKQGREVSVYVKSVKGAFCFPSVATIPWTIGYTFSLLVTDYKPFRAS